jgi:anthranilate phosphoribosyltransferase
MYISGKYDSVHAAVKVAEALIDSGKAINKLDEFIRCSNDD